jgi:hypothetical protein
LRIAFVITLHTSKKAIFTAASKASEASEAAAFLSGLQAA